MIVLCKGIAHPRCHLLTLGLAGNIDLRDRGMDGAFRADRAYVHQHVFAVDLHAYNVVH